MNHWYLIEAEEIKKRWQEYTELYKKSLNDPDNHNSVITYLQPDILESEVKWALGITTNKASGSDGIPAYCHFAYLISMQNTSCEMLGWMNHKLESRLLGEI